MSGPLDGVYVVELASLLPGPYCTAVLRGLGARVVKVEPPGGDQLRVMQADMHEFVNRGKESVTLDLKSPLDRRTLDALLAAADVLVTSFRRTTQRRLHIDRETVSAAHPHLIYVALAGFSDEEDSRAGHDLNYLAEAGVAELFGLGRSADHPVLAVQTADLSGALFAALAVTARLFAQARGATSDSSAAVVSLEDAVVALTRPRVAELLARDPDRSVPDTIAKPGYGTFRCADGRWAAIAALEEPLWRALVRVLRLDREAPGIAALDYQGRRRQVRAVNEAVEQAVARIPSAVLLRPDVSTAIAASEVRPLDAHPLTLRVPGESVADLPPAPVAGADTERVLAELAGVGR
ncbi:MAG: hypothetical protein GEU94_01355 [Micromonosporaceae bacterium]|nr:hypothetical protein [Micromonosporaceae bacterium]